MFSPLPLYNIYAVKYAGPLRKLNDDGSLEYRLRKDYLKM